MNRWRVILPGLAAVSDRALARTGGRRLLLMGVLPLLGVAVLLLLLGGWPLGIGLSCVLGGRAPAPEAP